MFSIVSLLVASLVLLLSAAFTRSEVGAFGFTLLGVLTSLVLAADFESRLILASATVILFLSKEFLKQYREVHEEFFASLLLSVAGALTTVGSQDFITFFVGLELMTVPLYGMIAYFTVRERSLEAAIKYLVLAGISVAFLLFGIALLYAQLHSLKFDVMAQEMGNAGPLLLIGFAFIVVGIGFKFSLAPFHFWTPDVYQGAPLPITAYLTTISKAAVVIFFWRFLTAFDGELIAVWYSDLSLLAIVSMLIGNWLALTQKDMSRFLAYSSISHMGYVLVALLSSGTSRKDAVLFYLLAYASASLLAFSSIQSNRKIPFVFALMSLMGLPLTAGFMAKFYILSTAFENEQWNLIAVLIMSSCLGVYAYLHMALTTMQTQTQKNSAQGSRALVWVLAVATIVLGVWPLAV